MTTLVSQFFRFVDWFNAQPGGTQTLVSIVIGVLLSTIGVLLWAVIHMAVEWWKRRNNIVRPSTQSSVWARLYARVPSRDQLPADVSIAIEQQELMYEWRMTLKTKSSIPRIAISITRLGQHDRIRVLPLDSEQSERKPLEASGFHEPVSTPDYWGLTVTFRDLEPTTTAEITVVRPLTKPYVLATSVIHIAEARAPSASIILPLVDRDAESARLTREAKALADRVWRSGFKEPGTLLILINPGDVPDTETRMTADARWADDTYNVLLINEMRVRVGKDWW